VWSTSRLRKKQKCNGSCPSRVCPSQLPACSH
jgi:hypothetical protein